MSTKHIASAPSRPTREQQTSGAFLGTPDGAPRRVRQVTVHNWVELVYRAFSQTLPTQPGQVAILALREATLGTKGAAAKPAAGVNPEHPWLKKLATSSLANGPDGSCVETSLGNMDRLGIPSFNGGTLADPNNSRGAMVQMMRNGRWSSMPLEGSKLRTISSPYGTAQAHVLDADTYERMAQRGQIPSGSVLFQTRHGWSASSTARGNDMGIVRNGGRVTHNYRSMSPIIYGDAKEVVVLVPSDSLAKNGAGAAGGAGGTGGAGGAGGPGSNDPAAAPVRDAERGAARYDAKGQPKVTFNDLLYVVWTDTTAASQQRAELYHCTVDPGDDASGTSGTPYQLEGHLYRAYPRAHKGVEGALGLYSSAKGKIVLAREKTRKTAVFANLESALVSAHENNHQRRFRFCNEEDNDTIHVHWSADYDGEALVKNWSTGCTVLRHARASKLYQRFIQRMEGASNREEIPYLVVSTKYVHAYDAWAQGLAPDDPADDPARVIDRAGLPAAPFPGEKPLRHIPSFVTEAFLKDVEARAAAADAAGAAADAEALREAARRVCIDTLAV